MSEAECLASEFRHVRLTLAREKGQPAGSREDGYELVVPLDRRGLLDPARWKEHQAACRFRRFRPGQLDQIGRVRRKPGGQWYFDYAAGASDNEIGFRPGQERFVVGEYVSISSGGSMHTFQVAVVETPRSAMARPA